MGIKKGSLIKGRRGQQNPIGIVNKQKSTDPHASRKNKGAAAASTGSNASKARTGRGK